MQSPKPQPPFKPPLECNHSSASSSTLKSDLLPPPPQLEVLSPESASLYLQRHNLHRSRHRFLVQQGGVFAELDNGWTLSFKEPRSRKSKI